MNELVDKEITSLFAKTLNTMKISDDAIHGYMYELSLPSLDADVREKLLGDGLEVTEGFVDDHLEMVEFQQFLTYGKRFVILYIRDQYLRQNKYRNGDLKPFHICWCDALKEAKAQHRYEERYVMTYNTSGSYKVNLYVRDKDASGRPYTQKKEQGVYRRLRVCQSCLHQLNWENFRQYCGKGIRWWEGGDSNKRWQIANRFDLVSYLQDAKNDTQRKAEQDILYAHPVSGTGQSVTKKEYVLTPAIKEELKKLAGYSCDLCHQQFNAKDLQIHHKNHNEGDNRRENLLVLCQACHTLIHDAEGGFTRRSQIASVAPVTLDAGKQRYRIYELAKIFRTDTARVLKVLKESGFRVVNGFSTVGQDGYQVLQKNFASPNTQTATKQEISETDYAIALERLSTLYEHGLGVVQDRNKAEEYRTLRKETDIAPTIPKTMDVAQQNLCRLRAEMGDASAYYDFAELQHTLGDGEDIAAGDNGFDAAVWYQKAAAYYVSIVDGYEQNKSPQILKEKVTNGDEKALQNLMALAEKGNVDAMLALGDLYNGGA